MDVQGTAVNAGTDGEQEFFDSTPVTLTATANTGSHFVSWSGDCEGTDPVCAVIMFAGRTVSATFELDLSVVYLPLVRK